MNQPVADANFADDAGDPREVNLNEDRKEKNGTDETPFTTRVDISMTVV